MVLPDYVEFALGRLREAGCEAWAVGGCVRDGLLRREPSDYDLATSALPERVKAIFSDCRTVDTGIKHGTVTLLLDGHALEVTTYRVDGEYADRRRPDSVSFDATLEQDLARRDFTINAMAYDGRELVDLFGGREDLRRGLVRCVGDPNRRFGEDALRILRAVRFAAKLGFEIEENTAQAATELRALLGAVSAERVRAELTGILIGGDAARALREYSDIIFAVLPELSPMRGFDQRCRWHRFDVWEHTLRTVDGCPPDAALRWAALLHDAGKPERFELGEDGQGRFYGHSEASAGIAERITERLRFDKATAERVQTLVRRHMYPIPTDAKGARRMLSRMGAEDAFRLLDLIRADRLATGREDCGADECENAKTLLHDAIAEGECFSLKSLAVNGHDALAAGLQGPQIGHALAALLSEVLDGTLPNNREILLSRLKALAQREQ